MAMGQPSSLTSYDSAPGSLLTGLADSVILSAAGTGGAANFLVNGSNRGGSESHLRTLFIGNSQSDDRPDPRTKLTGTAPSSENHMVRHDSSPPGLFSHIFLDHGALVGREPQLSLSGNRRFSQIHESGNMADKADHEHAGTSNYMGDHGFTISSSWDDHSDSINFATSPPPGKRSKAGISGDILTAYSDMDSQSSLPKASAEMGQFEKFFQLQQDQVPLKLRAKRGCATHPRSIAERERRIRISDKLRKLQEIVPNMEKPTSTSDMLDLAVQHIKDLQSQLQVMSQDRESCKCQNKQ